jgi:hypothetical protein
LPARANRRLSIFWASPSSVASRKLRRSRLAAAQRPHSMSRVLSGCNDSANAPSRSRIASYVAFDVAYRLGPCDVMPFGDQWHTPHNCCVRFAAAVADGHGRGRDGDCSPPPAQIPACGFPAPGSCRRSDVTGGFGHPRPVGSRLQQPATQVAHCVREP